ncbi:MULTISPECIES: histidine phosphatase family protein [unclassified Glaciimonas]|uniref:histidine phosphatase family protein n=1 Tax=unclassified Glaciimonas TaxID=2644401 RepID=UPI002AB449F0|nr:MULTISPECIES: histidine phosphatase family protein [unclassified Glaciimonas]MDY7548709.1 histidine phosphatase family protein [Glaciimonas sp. CA11.2]
MMQLHLVRHPKPSTPGAVSDLCYGRSDLLVSEEENTRLLHQLIKVLPKPVLMFSSPLLRCAGLADSLSRQPGWPAPTLDHRLVELDFGKWEMQSWQDIPRDEIDAWAGAVIDYRPGGGESVMQMAARVDAFYRALPRLHSPSSSSGENNNNGDDVAVICHAGTIRLLLACHALSQEASMPIGASRAIADIARKAANAAHKIGYGEVISLIC